MRCKKTLEQSKKFLAKSKANEVIGLSEISRTLVLLSALIPCILTKVAAKHPDKMCLVCEQTQALSVSSGFGSFPRLNTKITTSGILVKGGGKSELTQGKKTRCHLSIISK